MIEGQGRLLARPALAAGRAERPDGALRPAVRRDHRHRRPLRGLLALDDRPASTPTSSGSPARGRRSAATRSSRTTRSSRSPPTRRIPQALRALLGRVRAEALERAYPEVIVHAPVDHPVLDAFRQASGKVIDQEEYEGTTSMYHIPDVGRFLDGDPAGADAAGPPRRGPACPLELGLTVGDRRWLLHMATAELAGRARQAQPAAPDPLARGPGPAGDGPHRDRPRRRPRTASSRRPATAIDAARILFPVRPIWRSPLDSRDRLSRVLTQRGLAPSLRGACPRRVRILRAARSGGPGARTGRSETAASTSRITIPQVSFFCVEPLGDRGDLGHVLLVSAGVAFGGTASDPAHDRGRLAVGRPGRSAGRSWPRRRPSAASVRAINRSLADLPRRNWTEA